MRFSFKNNRLLEQNLCGRETSVNHMELKTNRDLYKSIAELISRQKGTSCTLEQYLCTLLISSAKFRHKEDIALIEFFELLVEGFQARNTSPSLDEECPEGVVPAYLEWQAMICRQITDLRQMAEAGLLKRDDRYFGLSAPSGRYWYNFDPLSFLECAAAGSLGGWEEGDDTGRQFVPGMVVAYDDSGKLVECDPRDLREPVEHIAQLSWEDFEEFLWCGQSYE